MVCLIKSTPHAFISSLFMGARAVTRQVRHHTRRRARLQSHPTCSTRMYQQQQPGERYCVTANACTEHTLSNVPEHQQLKTKRRRNTQPRRRIFIFYCRGGELNYKRSSSKQPQPPPQPPHSEQTSQAEGSASAATKATLSFFYSHPVLVVDRPQANQGYLYASPPWVDTRENKKKSQGKTKRSVPTSSLCHIKIAARTIRGADGGNAHKPRLLYSSSDERTTDRHGRVAELLCSLKDRRQETSHKNHEKYKKKESSSSSSSSSRIEQAEHPARNTHEQGRCVVCADGSPRLSLSLPPSECARPDRSQ